MKSNSCLILVVLAVLIVVQQAKSEECKALSGNGTLTSAGLAIGLNCFKFNNNDTKLIQLKNLVLNDKDIITMQDNKIVFVNYSSSERVPFLVVIGLENTVINITTAKNASVFEITYSDTLTVDFTNTMTTTLYSPKYSPLGTRQAPIKCNYTVTNNLPSNSIAAVSVVDSHLDSSSNFTINSMPFTNNTKHQDLFISQADQKIVVEINFNAKAQQDFILSVESVYEGCSGKKNLTTSERLFDNLPTQNTPYKCRILREFSPSNPLTIQVDKLDFVSGQDLMTIRESGSSRDPISRYFYTDLEHAELFISSSGVVLVTLDVGAPAVKKNISVTATLGLGDKFLKSGELSVPKTNVSVTHYWQLTADAGKLVNVQIKAIENAKATFYDGFQPSGKPITVFSSSNLNVNPVIGGSDMLVMVYGVNLTGDVKASFSSIDKDCDHLSTDVSGAHSFSPNGTNCICSIFPYVEGPTSNFNNIVLYIDSITLNEQEIVQVVSGKDSTQVLAKFETSVSRYQVIGSFNDGLRVVFTREGDYKGNSQVSFHYESVPTVCGGNLTTDGKPIIQSTPNYPDQYPLNADCVWSVASKDEPKKLLITVDALNLAAGHSLIVSTGTDIKANYTGTTVPESSLLVNANNTKIEFHSQGPSTLVASGAKFTYQSYYCADKLERREGNITLSTLQKTDCLWVIEVQGVINKTAILNFTLKNETEVKDLSSLVIYNGPSINSELLKNSLGVSILSRYNTIIVSAKKLTVNLTLLFTTYDCVDMCQNKVCMHPDWKCNGQNDCGDNTDEIDCRAIPVPTNTTTTASPTTTQKPEAADYSGWVKSGWVPACLAIGVIIGLVLYFAVPKIVRKIRGRGSNYSRMGDDRM